MMQVKIDSSHHCLQCKDCEELTNYEGIFIPSQTCKHNYTMIDLNCTCNANRRYDLNDLTDLWMSDRRFKRHQRDVFQMVQQDALNNTIDVKTITWLDLYQDPWRLIAPYYGDWVQVWQLSNSQLTVTQLYDKAITHYKIICGDKRLK